MIIKEPVVLLLSGAEKEHLKGRCEYGIMAIGAG